MQSEGHYGQKASIRQREHYHAQRRGARSQAPRGHFWLRRAGRLRTRRAFSGKDPTKVDRSAAYAARYVAKNIVAAGIADRCEIQLAYAIGVARPVSIFVDTFGTGKISDEAIVQLIRKHFELRPAGIIDMLDLRRPIYKQTAAYGHFGRTDVDLPWEHTDKAEALKKEAGI